MGVQPEAYRKGKALARLGEQYLENVRIFRNLGRPRFADKMLRNFAYIGLIHAILPNAKIVDVRRNPLDCCLANFKQMFGPGYPYSYDLADLGKYYNAYVDLMAHYDTVLPGKIHRIFYEELVEKPEVEILEIARLFGTAIRGAMPEVLRKRARGSYLQFGAGPHAHLQAFARRLAKI